MIRIISDFLEQHREVISVLFRIAVTALFWAFYRILKNKNEQ